MPMCTLEMLEGASQLVGRERANETLEAEPHLQITGLEVVKYGALVQCIQDHRVILRVLGACGMSTDFRPC